MAAGKILAELKGERARIGRAQTDSDPNIRFETNRDDFDRRHGA
jgi:hypothetical protein